LEKNKLQHYVSGEKNFKRTFLENKEYFFAVDMFYVQSPGESNLVLVSVARKSCFIMRELFSI
jgi:hypothetical protein